MILESSIEVGLWEGDNVHAHKFLRGNATGVPQCGSDLVRDTNVLDQNIVTLVVMTGLFSGNHRVDDNTERRELVKICSK